MADHPGPGPWKVAIGWALDKGETEPHRVQVIVDADGRIVVDGVTTANLELVLAAPEMAAMLRELAGQCNGIDFRKTGPNGMPLVLDGCGKCWNCRVKTLLAPIDRAKAGG